MVEVLIFQIILYENSLVVSELFIYSYILFSSFWENPSHIMTVGYVKRFISNK